MSSTNNDRSHIHEEISSISDAISKSSLFVEEEINIHNYMVMKIEKEEERERFRRQDILLQQEQNRSY
jgi:hypothetical protein